MSIFYPKGFEEFKSYLQTLQERNYKHIPLQSKKKDDEDIKRHRREERPKTGSRAQGFSTSKPNMKCLFCPDKDNHYTDKYLKLKNKNVNEIKELFKKSKGCWTCNSREFRGQMRSIACSRCPSNLHFALCPCDQSQSRFSGAGPGGPGSPLLDLALTLWTQLHLQTQLALFPTNKS